MESNSTTLASEPSILSALINRNIPSSLTALKEYVTVILTVAVSGICGLSNDRHQKIKLSGVAILSLEALFNEATISDAAITEEKIVVCRPMI